ncbi:RNA pseudouridine synthase 6, chloroplastic-like isoform X1 [Cucurbita pepo subsp. pepo]|uniref:RNA pseudouridine synthase 6, chloroplastic-like isoform X1 n=1 Tax=Cucurbita pepo subsp. pepo TaxID=3664 RepID=UPI000C9D6150|nr:RNA pseudouridine synthase 6, chloroplastic-like isoform X1 [Cucurbita pepo subsp. pepo]
MVAMASLHHEPCCAHWQELVLIPVLPFAATALLLGVLRVRRAACSLVNAQRQTSQLHKLQLTLQKMGILNIIVCFHVPHSRNHHELNIWSFWKRDLLWNTSLNPWIFLLYLIHFGAVHYALVCPQPPPTATPEQIRLFKKFTEPTFLKGRKSIKGKTMGEAQKTFRITHIDDFVEVGMYLRVYVHPKRFPRCYEIDWKSRIIAVTESYVVLDKPAGTSVGGTTNNIEETCVTFATRALGLTSPLWTTHQIDNCTEGCVILARTKEYCSIFHRKIREKKVMKLYLALAAAPVPMGIITHYMRPINLAPRIVSKDCIDGWNLCQLEVLECREVSWPVADIEAKYCIEDCGWPSKKKAYECKINLLTGRTHQIRAQLADCGAPLVGDSIYMPAAVAEMANPGSNPFGRSKKEYTSEEDKEIAVAEWIALHGKEPALAIGLQAYEISWDSGEHSYNAGTPWWKQELL